MIVPQTTAPEESATVVRMASIPHGTTDPGPGQPHHQPGPPTIPGRRHHPVLTGSCDEDPFSEPDRHQQGHARIPQDLTSFIAAETITQAMLTDPNTVLRNHLAAEDHLDRDPISITTNPARPLFGGGAENIAFLMGTAAACESRRPSPTRRRSGWGRPSGSRPSSTRSSCRSSGRASRRSLQPQGRGPAGPAPDVHRTAAGRDHRAADDHRRRRRRFSIRRWCS